MNTCYKEIHRYGFAGEIMANIQERRDKSGKLISYSIRVFRGRGADGKQLKPFTATFDVSLTWTEKSARKKAEAFAATFEKQCKEGTATDTRQTFASYCDYVIDLKSQRGVKHSTTVRYRELTTRIYPAIGHIKLKDLRVDHLNTLYTDLSKNGTRKGGERATRDDLTFPSSNKQLNFLQHIYRSLNRSGHARAAVVLPDNVLFADGDGEKIRRDLMEKCNLHTILRLPTGIFYAQGVKTNVLFFTRGAHDTGNTREIWFYDLRSDMPSFGKTNPLKESHFDEFVTCYAGGDLSARHETWSVDNPNGRWRRYTYEEILARDKTSLDITWMKSSTGTDDYTLAELLEQIKTKSANIAKAVAALEELIGEVDE